MCKKTKTRPAVLVLISMACCALLLSSSCLPGAPGRDSTTGELEKEATTGELEKEAANCDQEPRLPRVGLYIGMGIWEDSLPVLENFLDHYGFSWSTFDQDDALSLRYGEDFELIWFPGGSSADYRFAIDDHSAIRSFVQAGGLFVGSCAGAYYAAETMRWFDTKTGYPLKLFPGKAVGPLVGQVGWGEKTGFDFETAHPVNRGFGATKEMYYFDGPYFVPGDDNAVEVLARYSINNEPAVIAGRLGEGRYLLLGPHPELSGYSSDPPAFNPEGGDGSQWPWLFSALSWLALEL